MEEDINTDTVSEDCNLVTDEGTVIQVIMRGDDGDTLIPSNHLIQINTDEGQMQYLEVTDENGKKQYLQVMPDGQAQLIQFTDGEQEVQLETTELMENTLAMVDNQSVRDVPGDQIPVTQQEQPSLMPVFNSVPETETKTEESVDNNESSEMIQPEKKIKTEDIPIEENKTIHVAPSNEELQVTPSTADQTETAEAAVAEEAGQKADDQVKSETAQEAKPATERTAPSNSTCPEPDLSSPIELKSETIVTINSKKCVLKVDPDTGKIRAYPLKPPAPAAGKRPRGRPRKVHNADDKKSQSSTQTVEKPSAAPTEQENSAAEGLLGLSESDGRRKSLRVKKKPHVLAEYEIGAIEGVEDPDEDDGAKLPADDKDVVISSVHTSASGTGEKRGRGRPAKTPTTTNQLQNFLANLGLPVKRGRGRPRRYPPPGSSSQVPTFIIPQSSGQAVIMKPVQGLTVKPQPGHVTILPAVKQEKPANPTPSAPKFPPIVIQNADGTQTHIVASLPDDSKAVVGDNPVTTVSEASTAAEETTPVTVILSGVQEAGQVIGSAESGQVETKATTGYDVSLQSGQDTSNLETSTASVTMANLKSEDGVKPESVMTDDATPVSTESTGSQPLSATITLPREDGTTAVIEVPHNLVPLLMSGKSEEPIKIGLKQTESDLEKLRCEKCNFQSYYMQQYQEHLSVVHEGEIFKCKCCHFSCFDEEGLNEHYKTMHPKNVCSVCNFRAEHAYVVKRHMMRHNSKGCKCHLCGKTYKDRYILKMHIKMVHMPAEVLFECSICSKKFTRKAHLKRHTRIHDPEKPFKCPFCDYRGCERSDVTKHVVIHNVPKYSCEVCGKFFRHMKNKELHLKRHKGQRDYKCGICDFYGYTFTDIRKHIDRKHADAKVVCGKCGSVFRSEHQLSEHSKTCVSNLITIKPDDFSVLTEVTEDKGSISQMSATHIASDGHIFMEGNHDYIRVEQVKVDLEDEGNVNLTDAQISETSMAESQLVEEHMSADQAIHSVDPVILTRGNEIIQLSADMDHNIIEGATHIQISETGELIKIGELPGGATVQEGSVLPPGVTLVEAHQYKDCVELQSKFVNSSELTEGETQLVQEAAMECNEEELAISQVEEPSGQVELVGDGTEVNGVELTAKTELQEEELVGSSEVEQGNVLMVDGSEVQTRELVKENVLTRQAEVSQ